MWPRAFTARRMRGLTLSIALEQIARRLSGSNAGNGTNPAQALSHNRTIAE
jgi:hypothetical protein